MRRNWTRDELILAFNLYCKIPFRKYNQRTIEVIELAKIIERTPSAVAFKLVNFASLDPFHQKRGVKGMKNGSKLDKKIYHEFSNNWDTLVYESELLLLERSNQKNPNNILIKEIDIKSDIKGKDKLVLTKKRVNQSFFRKVILSIYSNKCAITKINLPELLIASHIVPWAIDNKNRLNPSNGICLSPLYDKIFDIGFITLSDQFEIIFSRKLNNQMSNELYHNHFGVYEGKSIDLPEKFLPKIEFLQYHRDNIFKN